MFLLRRSDPGAHDLRRPPPLAGLSRGADLSHQHRAVAGGLRGGALPRRERRLLHGQREQAQARGPQRQDPGGLLNRVIAFHLGREATNC